MADQDSVPDLLADLLEGRIVAQAVGSEAASLAMLARRIERLAVPGPSPASEVHIRTRVIATMEGNQPGRAWLGGWLGGPGARLLRERLAAGALLFAAAGGSASVATGVSPIEFASGVGDLARSIVVNLTPGEGTGEKSLPTPEASPTTPVPGQATTQGQTPVPTGTVSPASTSTANTATTGAGAPLTPTPSQSAEVSATVGTPSGTPPTSSPTPIGTATTQSPTPPGPQQTNTPLPSPSSSPGASSTPDGPDDSDNRTRTPEPGDDSGGGNSRSGNSGSGNSGSGSSGSGSDD